MKITKTVTLSHDELRMAVRDWITAKTGCLVHSVQSCEFNAYPVIGSRCPEFDQITFTLTEVPTESAK